MPRPNEETIFNLAMMNRSDDGLPEGWVWTTIGEIADLVGGGTPSRKNPDYFTGDIVWLTPTQIPKNQVAVLYDSEERITTSALQQSSAKLVPAGSVLFTSRATIGSVAIAGTDVTTNQGFASFICRKGIYNSYLAYWLLASIELLKSRATGTTFKEISKAKLRPLNFPLAPLPEQRRIVAKIEELLTRLDAGVAALERARANLRRYKASVLKAACEGRLVPTEAELARKGSDSVSRGGPGGRPREKGGDKPRRSEPGGDKPRPDEPRADTEKSDYEPASELLARILVERRARWEAEQWKKEIEKAQKKAAQARRRAVGQPARVRDLTSEEWQSIPEADYAPFLPKNDQWKAKYKAPQPPDTSALPGLPEGWCWASLEQLSWQSSYGTSQKCDYDANGPPVIRIPNIVNNHLDLQDIKYASMPDELEEDNRLTPGDLLIIRTNGSKDLIGRAALVRQRYDTAYHYASYLIRYRMLEVDSIPTWAIAVWDATLIRQWIERNAATTAGQYNVSVGKLNPMPIPIPPTAEQHRIVAEVERRLSVVAETEAALEADLQRAARLRQSILKRAFEGKLVPQDPDDEPAGVLLERIQKQRSSQATEVEQPSLL